MRTIWPSQYGVDYCVRVCLKRHTHPSPKLFSHMYVWWSHWTDDPCFRLFPVSGRSHDLVADMHPNTNAYWVTCILVLFSYSSLVWISCHEMVDDHSFENGSFVLSPETSLKIPRGDADYFSKKKKKKKCLFLSCNICTGTFLRFPQWSALSILRPACLEICELVAYSAVVSRQWRKVLPQKTALQLLLLCTPAYVPAAHHCPIYGFGINAVCHFTLNVWSSRIGRGMLSFKLQDSFQNLSFSLLFQCRCTVYEQGVVCILVQSCVDMWMVKKKIDRWAVGQLYLWQMSVWPLKNDSMNSCICSEFYRSVWQIYFPRGEPVFYYCM